MLFGIAFGIVIGALFTAITAYLLSQREMKVRGEEIKKSLKTYYHANVIDQATFDPKQSKVTWNCGNVIAQLYYYLRPEDMSLRLYDVNSDGERFLVNSTTLVEWLDKLRIGSTESRHQLIGSRLDN